jgi:sugar phosphate isomerase/epimerase
VINRRSFLTSSTAGLLGTAVVGPLAGRDPDIKFPTQPRKRLAVASYPFRGRLQLGKGSMKLVDFPAFVVSQFQVPGIEPLNEHFESTDPAYLDRLRGAVEKAHAHIVNIPVSFRESLYDPDAGKRQKAIQESNHWIDVATHLNSPGVRIHIEGVRGVEPDAGHAAESLKKVADYGASKNVVVSLENDDPRSEDAFFIVSIIERVNNPYLRALPDFCNSMIEKNGDEKFNYDAVKAMFQHAYNISHVKDSEVDGKKVFRVDLAKTFSIAKAAGYRGYYSMEWEGPTDPVEGTKFLIAQSIKNLS